MSIKERGIAAVFSILDGEEFPAALLRGPPEAFDFPRFALFGDLGPVAFRVFDAALVAASYIFGYGHLLDSF